MIPLPGLPQLRPCRRAGCSPCSAALFTLSSAMCGMAWDIQSMTVFRAIQGFVGGAMVPTVFATGFAMFAGKSRGDDPGHPRPGLMLAPRWALRWAAGSPMLPAGAGCSSSTSSPGCIVTSLSVLGKVDEPNFGDAETVDWLQPVAGRVPRRAWNMCWRKDRATTGSSDPHIAAGGWLSLVGCALFLERSFAPAGRSSAVAVPPADLTSSPVCSTW